MTRGPSCVNCTAGGPSPTPKSAEEMGINGFLLRWLRSHLLSYDTVFINSGVLGDRCSQRRPAAEDAWQRRSKLQKKKQCRWEARRRRKWKSSKKAMLKMKDEKGELVHGLKEL